MSTLHNPGLLAESEQFACWERHGFELRTIECGSHYLIRHFMNFTFVVRQANPHDAPLDASARYKLQFKPRDGGKLSCEVRMACGLADLVRKVRSWHSELNASTISPTTPCSSRLIADGGRRMRSCLTFMPGCVRR